MNSVHALLSEQVGKYIVTKKLGAGNIGIVYQAYDLKNNSLNFAIKCVSKEIIKSNRNTEEIFETEWKCMRALEHLNCLKLIDFIETSTDYYLVLRLCSEGNYFEYLKKRGISSIPENEAIYFLKQLLDGFRELHKNKIIVRNFTLSDLLIDAGPIAVIGDFGFAKNGIGLNHCGFVMPLTMAPEVFLGKQSDSKADFYSIGCCFYYMLYGKYPFQAMNAGDLAETIKNYGGINLKLPNEKLIVSAEVEDLLKRLIEFDPRIRIGEENIFTHSLFEKSNQSIKKMINQQNCWKEQQKKQEIVNPEFH